MTHIPLSMILIIHGAGFHMNIISPQSLIDGSTTAYGVFQLLITLINHAHLFRRRHETIPSAGSSTKAFRRRGGVSFVIVLTLLSSVGLVACGRAGGDLVFQIYASLSFKIAL